MNASSTYLQRGDKVEEFENRFESVSGLTYNRATSQARIALYYLMKSLNLPKGSEVLLHPITLPDMANVIRVLGLKARYIEIDPENFSMDVEDLKSKINDKSKILLYTSLAGYVDQIDEVRDLCKERNIFFIQDLTQAIGCLYAGQPLASYSDASVFALCDLKVIHTHMGAMMSTNSKEIKDSFNKIMDEESRSISKKYFLRFLVEDKLALLLLNRKFFTLFVYLPLRILYSFFSCSEIEGLSGGKGLKIFGVTLFKGLFGGGGNIVGQSVPKNMLYDYTNLQAQIGLEQLEKYEERDKRRISNSQQLMELLSVKAKQRIPKLDEKLECSFWKLPFYINDNEIDSFQSFMFSQRVDVARSNLPCVNVTIDGMDPSSTPRSERSRRNMFFLPMHHYLTESEVKRIARLVNKFFEG